LQVEGNVSYDSLFKWIGQGQLGLTLPFGSRSKVSYCSPARFTRNLALSERAVQRVDRNEIIPVDTKKYYASAINPLTGLPYTFWFVNNLSHSAGTFESPFPTLADAIAASSVDEIIMVYTGDGTSNGLNAGAAPFALKDHQQLLGAGFEYSFPTQYGTVMLPALDQGRPYLTANQDVSGVSLAERNTVSGLLIQITDTSSGSITAGIYNNPNINQTKIFNNSFILHGYAYAASLVNCGNVTISQNSVQGESNSTGFDVFDANQSINISGNTISGCSNKAGIHVEGIVTHCAISDNSVRNCGTGIDFYPSSVSDVLIENNLTSNCATGISDITLGNGVETHQILGNTISDSSLIALTFDADGASSGVITVSSNTITGTGVTGLLVDVDNTANILLHVTNNSIYAGSIGSSVESHGNSTICFRFQDNQGNLSTQLTQNHPSLFQLEPYTGNTMPLSWTGTITNVSQSTCN
jgi:hypothetical protein